MKGKKHRLTIPKKRKVPNPPSASNMGGVHMTTAKLNNQLVCVEIALALVRIALGLTSAGINHGSSSQVLVGEKGESASSKTTQRRKAYHPNEIKKVNNPTTAPYVAVLSDWFFTSNGIKQNEAKNMDSAWPAVPHKNILRRPKRSIIGYERNAESA